MNGKGLTNSCECQPINAPKSLIGRSNHLIKMCLSFGHLTQRIIFIEDFEVLYPFIFHFILGVFVLFLIKHTPIYEVFLRWMMNISEAAPFWAPPRKIVDDEYRTFEFSFEPVEGTEHTGPIEFEAKQSMNLDEYLTYTRSWSAYQTARQMGFELLRNSGVLGEGRMTNTILRRRNFQSFEDWEGREMNHVPPYFT